MKITLITTTIYLPEVLRLYAAAGESYQYALEIIVAGDKRTPHRAVRALCDEIGAIYLSDEDQQDLGYACSAFIGWNCIMRRDVALLEAIKGRPDVIVTIDDDNVPLDPLFYFEAFADRLAWPYSGPLVTSPEGWFNVGDLFDPPFVHRGFPYGIERDYGVLHLVEGRVGVVAGLWLGDPDVNAVERLVSGPDVRSVPELARQGVAVAPGTFAPFNSQNTAYTLAYAPLMAVWPAVGRYDDIWASYLAQRVMWEHGAHLVYGRPFTYQQRNPQATMRNLKDEVYGMEHTARLCADLREIELSGGTPVENLAQAWAELCRLDYLPERLLNFGLAWCDDLERIL